MEKTSLVENDLAVTNAATTPTGLPEYASYGQIFNPHATASIAFSLNGKDPVVNGLGITLAPLGSYTFDNPSNVRLPLGKLKIISSTASQAATLFWG